MATGMLLSMGCGSNTQAQQPTANHPMAFDVVSIREVKEQSEELLMNSRFIGDTFLAKNASCWSSLHSPTKRGQTWSSIYPDGQGR